MSARRILVLLRRELRAGPRSALFLLGLALPLILSAILQLVFGSLFEPTPRLALMSAHDSEIGRAFAELDGVSVSSFASPAELRRAVRANDVDAGLILPAGFDAAARAGQRPILQLHFSGGAALSTRQLLAARSLDLVRAAKGDPGLVRVETRSAGADVFVPLVVRLTPLVLILVIMVCAVLVPAASLVGERETGTLQAVLATPARLTEVVAAKGLLGIVLALTTAVLALWLNGVSVGSAFALAGTLLLASAMCAEFGVVLGLLAPSASSLLILFRLLILFLAFPAVAWLWSGFPEWLARLGPTYYFLDPLYRGIVDGAGVRDVAGNLAIGATLCAGLAVVIAAAGRRLALGATQSGR